VIFPWGHFSGLGFFFQRESLFPMEPFFPWGLFSPILQKLKILQKQAKLLWLNQKLFALLCKIFKNGSTKSLFTLLSKISKMFQNKPIYTSRQNC